MFSIRKKLILLVSGCTLLAAVLLGGISIVRITKVINRSSQNTLQLQCRATKETLDSMLSTIEQGVNRMQDVILSEGGAIDRIMQEPAYRDAFINQVLLENRRGILQVKGCLSYYFWLNQSFTKEPEGYFWVYDPHYTRFLHENVPDVTVHTEYDIARAGRYYLPQKTGEATWISPYFDELIEQEIISYVVPIYVRGTFLGVVGMDMQYEDIAKEVKDIQLYKTGYASLFDTEERVVYHKDYNPGDFLVVQKNNMLTYALHLNNNWNLVVLAPKREVHAERRALIGMLIFAMALVAGIFILISIKVTAHIINPLMDLIVAIKKIGNGDLNVQLPSGSNDEVGLLARSFEETIQRLPDYLYRDSLTGMRNVSAYKRAIADIQTRIDTNDMVPFALAVMDINNLKLVNDTYGHEAGNDLITSATSIMGDVFKRSPIYRIGGDEFVALLDVSVFERREAVIAEFTERLDRSAIFVEKERLPVSVAIGIAAYEPRTDKTYDDVFNRADEAMYENKKAIKAQRNMPSR